MKILVSYQVNDNGKLSEKDTELEIPSGAYLYHSDPQTMWDDVLGRTRMMLHLKEPQGASLRIWYIKTV